MTGFKERISLIVDMDTKGGTTALKSFGISIREAEGLGGKLKAGWSSATDSISKNAGALALAGGTALVAFGIKAVGAFTETATAARDFGAATGLSVEKASRWIAVADDMGLSADDLQAGFGMVSKSLDADKWDKYGIATHDAGGKARDMNAIMLDTFDVLSKETNLSERARLGKELLGKGYAAMAPLIGKSRAEYEKMLASVEKGQVITAGEAAQAEKMKEAQDALGDALKEVTLAFGGMVAGLSPLIKELADDILWVSDHMAMLGVGAAETETNFNRLSKTFEFTKFSLDDVRRTAELYNFTAGQTTAFTAKWAEANGMNVGTVDILGDVLGKLNSTTKQTAEATRGVSGDLRKAKEAFEGVATATAAAKREYDNLTGSISNEQAWLNVLDDLDAYKAKTDDATASDREKREAFLTTQQALVDYTKSLGDIPEEKRTAVLAAIASGDLAAAQFILADLTRDRDVRITPIVGKGADGSFKIVAGARASGGPVTAGQPYIVGENRPELFVPDSNGTILPSVPTGGGGGSTINLTINTTQPVDGAMIVRELRTYERRNGPGWRA